MKTHTSAILDPSYDERDACDWIDSDDDLPMDDLDSEVFEVDPVGWC